MRDGEDIAEKARQGRTADCIVVLFSRTSLPRPWPRSQWEGALIHEPRGENVRIAFLECDDCSPPKVLEPVFERRQLRQLKRWLRQSTVTFIPPDDVRDPGADLEWLGVALADRAGEERVDNTALAFEFVRAYSEDFDEVVYVDCGSRSVAAISGDLAAQLGLKLEGPVEENLERLRDFCSARRFLVLLDDAVEREAQEFAFGGRCSTLISRDRWTGAPPSELREAQHALAAGFAEWPVLCRHARNGRRLTREQGRIAECFELMQQWSAFAEERNDRKVLEEAAREMVWILESWGLAREAAELEYRRASEFDEQMSLF